MAATKIGSCLQAQSGRWYARIWWYEADGTRQIKTRATGYSVKGNNKRKAEEKMLEIQADFESKLTLNSNDMLFSDWMFQWLDETRHGIQDSTYAEQKRMIENCIRPHFDQRKIKLCDLKTYHIQEFYNSRLKIDNVSSQTVRRYHAIIHRALKYAVKMERLNKNPSDNVELPKAERHIAERYSEQELKKLLEATQGTSIETPVYLGAWFGLRRGEIIGLQWNKVDFDNCQLTVDGVVRDKGEKDPITGNLHYVLRTKTEASRRTLPMSQTAVAYLRELKEKQEARRACDSNYNRLWDGFVCVRENGDLIPPRYVTNTFKQLCKKAGLEPIKFHELRHTNLSIFIERGANMKTVQEWAGHSTYKQTADTYAHIQAGSKKVLADTMERVLYGEFV